jgi:hypothetical protein
MLGDPSARTVDVYVPAGHNGEGLPLLVDLVGFTGSGLSHTNWAGFRENVPEHGIALRSILLQACLDTAPRFCGLEILTAPLPSAAWHSKGRPNIP